MQLLGLGALGTSNEVVGNELAVDRPSAVLGTHLRCRTRVEQRFQDYRRLVHVMDKYHLYLSVQMIRSEIKRTQEVVGII